MMERAIQDDGDMQRRTLLGGLAAAIAGTFTPRQSVAMNVDELNRRQQEYMAKALANFPGQLIETTGKDAYDKWRELKRAGRGTPIILGGDESSYNNLFNPFGPNGPHVPAPPSVESILASAERIHFPDDLIAKNKADNEEARKMLLEEYRKNPDMPLMTMIDVN
ncbi:MAG TPA: hypothetical protein VMF58_18510, partial [Rhizomicrobium sp.]|nr:hypothetical protein [Rhizomicrobium sp.]